MPSVHIPGTRDQMAFHRPINREVRAIFALNGVFLAKTLTSYRLQVAREGITSERHTQAIRRMCRLNLVIPPKQQHLCTFGGRPSVRKGREGQNVQHGLRKLKADHRLCCDAHLCTHLLTTVWGPTVWGPTVWGPTMWGPTLRDLDPVGHSLV
jgi:hypothetical protein